MSIATRLRQPEYTGVNRCVPCTAVNVSIAAVVSVLVAAASTVLGVGVFVLSLGAIYLRGYLVPGTPKLTKRYFPERILRWFDKDTSIPTTEEAIEINPERILTHADAVEPCRERADLCLTSQFRESWREHIRTTRTDSPDEENLEETLNCSRGDNRIMVSQRDGAFVAHTDDAVVGQWGSQAAVTADIAAATELETRVPNWSNFAPAEVARVLMSLRIFIEQCPNCGGPVQVEQEVIESCCRSYDVVASACQDCDARLFEMEWNEGVVDEVQARPEQPV